ncbi:unnamed protein product [Amoebophrya sp. A120]|nr:unnamed protein product [Amoebophrya sp. A120]|eukprot:GSA120T00011240001.1
MDATYYLQSAQEAGGELLEPVSSWGARMSSGAISFFSAADIAGFPLTDVAKYFSEAMRLSDPANLKSGLSNIHSIVRGSIGLYAALATPENTSNLAELMKFRDTVMCDKAASLLSGVMCRYPAKFTTAQVKACSEYSGTEAGKLDVLANLLKCSDWRSTLFPPMQMRILSGVSSSSVPTMYKALMCVWLTSFNKDVEMPTSVISSINEILKTVRTEKVIRIALMAIENLLAKKTMCEEMAEQETMNLVSALEYEKWRDPELIALIKKLISALQAEVKILTNFERFEREVMSGRLKWGFIHSEKFWLENVLKCEGSNFKVIDHLMVIVRTSKDAETLAVACHDLGEFARLHPVGKHIATTRGAKDKMLELMSASQREVAREALLCVQKLMLQSSGLNAITASA